MEEPGKKSKFGQETGDNFSTCLSCFHTTFTAAGFSYLCCPVSSVSLAFASFLLVLSQLTLLLFANEWVKGSDTGYTD